MQIKYFISQEFALKLTGLAGLSVEMAKNNAKASVQVSDYHYSALSDTHLPDAPEKMLPKSSNSQLIHRLLESLENNSYAAQDPELGYTLQKYLSLAKEVDDHHARNHVLDRKILTGIISVLVLTISCTCIYFFAIPYLLASGFFLIHIFPLLFAVTAAISLIVFLAIGLWAIAIRLLSSLTVNKKRQRLSILKNKLEALLNTLWQMPSNPKEFYNSPSLPAIKRNQQNPDDGKTNKSKTPGKDKHARFFAPSAQVPPSQSLKPLTPSAGFKR
jgi:hypothetical protein